MSKGVFEDCGGDEEVKGQRSAPPSDTSRAREAVTTRSAKVQVSERDSWVTRPSGDLSCVPAQSDLPSFLLFPACHSSVTHPSLPSTITLFALLALCLPTETIPCHPLILASFLFPTTHSIFFQPSKLNSTTGFNSVGQAHQGSSLPAWIVQHVLPGLIFKQKHMYICTQIIGMLSTLRFPSHRNSLKYLFSNFITR